MQGSVVSPGGSGGPALQAGHQPRSILVACARGIRLRATSESTQNSHISRMVMSCRVNAPFCSNRCSDPAPRAARLGSKFFLRVHRHCAALATRAFVGCGLHVWRSLGFQAALSIRHAIEGAGGVRRSTAARGLRRDGRPGVFGKCAPRGSRGGGGDQHRFRGEERAALGPHSTRASTRNSARRPRLLEDDAGRGPAVGLRGGGGLSATTASQPLAAPASRSSAIGPRRWSSVVARVDHLDRDHAALEVGLRGDGGEIFNLSARGGSRARRWCA